MDFSPFFTANTAAWGSKLEFERDDIGAEKCAAYELFRDGTALKIKKVGATTSEAYAEGDMDSKTMLVKDEAGRIVNYIFFTGTQT